MNPIEVKTHNCSNSEVIKICIKCGFSIHSGGKHDKIKTKDGKFITMVPRHNHIKRETARGIFNAMQEAGAPIVIIK